MIITTSSRKSAAFKAGVLASSVALAAVLAGCNGNKGNSNGTIGSSGTNSGAVATVNGEAIDRDALHAQLEAAYGETAVRQLIDYTLVTQKLKADKLAVTDAEVNDAINARGVNTPEIADIVKAKGVRYDALQRQMRYQLAIDKLLTKDVKATDDQIKKWFETRRAYYDAPAKAKIGILLSTSKEKANTMAAQLKSKSKTFPELVTAQKTANDPAAASSIAESPTMIAIDALPKLLKDSLTKLQTGQTSNVISLKEGMRTAYVILRLVQKQPAVKADYTKLKSQVDMDYKLEQVAKKLNSENPGNPPFEQTLKQVKQAVAQQSGGQEPGFRDILTFITQTESAKLTGNLRTAAKVESSDPTYTKVVESYKPAVAPAVAPSAPPASAPAGATPKAPSAPTAPPASATPKAPSAPAAPVRP